MGLVGPLLGELFPEAPLTECLWGSIDALADKGHFWAAQFTPVRSGNAKTNWYRTGARKRRLLGLDAYEDSVKNDTSYIDELNNGTGLWGPAHAKYPIEPRVKSALSWVTQKPIRTKSGHLIPAGTRVFASKVMHPGSRGKHMVENAAGVVEGQADAFTREPRERWAREMESVARTAPPVVR